MGLNVSHNAFGGAYSAFNRFRSAVCDAMGGRWPEGAGEQMQWYWGDGYGRSTHPGLYEFLSHSDCDGEIDADTAGKLANEMEALLPALDTMGMDGGHIEATGGYGKVARKWIAGCREASAANEPLEFY